MLISQIVLIIDSNLENSTYAHDFFKESMLVKTITADNLELAYQNIDEFEPDLIILHDNFNEDVGGICATLRQRTNSYRPVIMVLSSSEDINQKIDLLRIGADDIQSELIDPKELSLRVFAHIRRHVDELTDQVTKLPYVNLSYRILKRNLKLKTDEIFALMYLDIDNFDPYKEIYGGIAAEKLLQTVIAIIKTSLGERDFLGRVGDDEFIIFTNPEKAEKIAAFLSYYFDSISPKFYTETDSTRGYLIIDGDEKIGRRVPLASLSIGISSNKFNKGIEFEELLNKAVNVHRLAKFHSGSHWINDSLKIAGKATENISQKKILVIENDASLSYLLLTTLEMQGYNTESINSSDNTMEIIGKSPPNLIIFDINSDNAESDLDICRAIKQFYPYIKIIVSTVDYNKEKILDSGVDLYIPKPYDLMSLFNWVSRFLNYDVPH